MNEDLRQRLITAARAQRIVYYSDLQQLLDVDMDFPPDRERIGRYLGDVSKHEVSEGRPMLSSVVWRKDNSPPGHGFFKLALELGLAEETEPEDAVAVRELTRTPEGQPRLGWDWGR
jgi:hypothetical protein